jgi:hypothetical protein
MRLSKHPGAMPGELAKIVRQAVAPYLDKTIDRQLREAKAEAEEMVEDEWRELMAPEKRKLESLRKGVESVTKRYRKQAAALNRRLQRDLRQFRKPLAKLQSDVSKASNDFNPDLPERPAQAVGEQDEAECLFDSSRSYLDQLRFYKAQR